MNPYLRYTLILGTAAATALTGTLAVNAVFDPFWYLGGNKVGDINFAYNERVTKTNRYLATRKHRDYDCLVFGSSRTTLLDHRLLPRQPCFNFAFAGGRVEEFTAYARWLRQAGARPDYIVVGIDHFNFFRLDRPLNIPNFIAEDRFPPGVMETYLSLDALKFSAKQFLHVSPRPRQYDGEFVGEVADNVGSYRPRIDPNNRPVRSDAVAAYQQLQAVFPDAVFVGYVPPVSAWEMASHSQTALTHLVCSVHELSQRYDAVYDFSVPNPVTRDPDNTYDGDHYWPAINRQVAHRIGGAPDSFGLRVDQMSRADYLAAYRDAILEFRHDLGRLDAEAARALPALDATTFTAAACDR